MLYRKEKYGISDDFEGLKDLYYKAKKELKREYDKDPNPECGYWLVKKEYTIESDVTKDGNNSGIKEYGFNDITIYFVLLSNYELSSEFTKDKQASDQYWKLVKSNMSKIDPFLFRNIGPNTGGSSMDKSKSLYILLRSSNIESFLTKNSGHDNVPLNDLYHEVTHQYDHLVSMYTVGDKHSVGNFGFLKNITQLKNNNERDLFKKANYLLYVLWDSSEFNAHQNNAGNHVVYDVIPSYRRDPINGAYKSLQSYIKDLSNYKEESFWETLRSYVLDNTISRTMFHIIFDMSSEKFRSWFLKETEKKLKKFYDSTAKNVLSKRGKDSENKELADKIEKEVEEEKNPIQFSIDHYFPKIAYSYPVNMKISFDSFIQDTDDFNKNGMLNIAIPKLHFNKEVSLDDLTLSKNNTSFREALVDKDKNSILVVSSLINKLLNTVSGQ